jgi:hypothetical protein
MPVLTASMPEISFPINGFPMIVVEARGGTICCDSAHSAQGIYNSYLIAVEQAVAALQRELAGEDG